MKKYIYIISLALIAISCNDFLEKNPDQRATLDELGKIKEFLVSAYPVIGYQFTEFSSDNVTDLGLNYVADYPEITVMQRQLYQWETPDLLEWIDNPNDYWYACYSAIAYANYALKAINELVQKEQKTESSVAPVRAEALMCRAYAHFMLVNLYGEHYAPDTADKDLGIPIIYQSAEYSGVKYTRNTVKEVYDFIEKDIEEAFPNITNSTYLRPKWHFNRAAAATFASRFYLYRGLPSDWDKVIHYANQALGSKPASLMRDLIASRAESDYTQQAINFSLSELPCNFLLISTVSYNGFFGNAGRYSMNTPLYTEKISGFVHPTVNTVATGRYLWRPMLGYGISYPNKLVNKYHQYFRLSDINSNEGWPYVMYVVFSAEEALLNMIEAYAMKKEFGNAVEGLNSYYSRRLANYNATVDIITEKSVEDRYKNNMTTLAPHYSLTEKQIAFIQCALVLRNAEFMYEGLRWFDIKRMHLRIEHEVYDGETLILGAKDPKRVYELPSNALSDGIIGNFNPETDGSDISKPPVLHYRWDKGYIEIE